MAKTSAPASKTTKLNGAIPRVADHVHASDESSTGERIYERFQQAQADMLEFFGAPGWKRTLVAFLSTVLIGAGIGYAAGAVLEWMMIGAIATGTSLFISMTVYVLGIVLACAVAWRVGGRITGAILTGEADERAIAAYDATKAFVSKMNPMRLFGAKPDAATVH